MDPLVSILIPVYNGDRWLTETLESALCQTWPKKEVIVVDDGSSDNSLALARRFQSSRVKVMGETHRGQTATLNRALSEAQGDYIQYLDADDLLAMDKVEIQVKRLMSDGSDALATSKWARFYTDDRHSASFEDHADFRDYPEPVEWLIQAWNGRGTMPPVAWLFPRAIVERAGPWNETLSLSNDTEYFTRAVLCCSRIVFCGEARGYYRSGNSSLSGRRDREALESAFRVSELCTRHLLAFEDSARTQNACASLWQFFAYQTYPEAPDLVRSAEDNVRVLGGTTLELSGSSLFRSVLHLVGWKTARRMQRAYYNLRYRKI